MFWYVGFVVMFECFMCLLFFKPKTAYEMRISDWSSTCALPICRGEQHVGELLDRDDQDRADQRPGDRAHAADDRDQRRAHRDAGETEHGIGIEEIGRASGRERVSKYV